MSSSSQLRSLHNPVESVQQLLAEGRLIDVRIRCGDHGHSDGIGAHKMVLSAASPKFLKPVLLQADVDEEQLVCIHLPDFGSAEVGPVLSLLYYGEIWVSREFAAVCRGVLDVLGMGGIELSETPPNADQTVEEISVPVVESAFVRVKMEPQQQQQPESQPLPVEKGSHTLLNAADIKKEMIESMDDEDRRLSSGSSDNEEAAADEDVKISTDLVGCDLCPFKTSSQSSLQAHAAVHKLREKRSRCSICQFEALTPGRLRHHILDMHAAMSDDPTTGDILFKCLASDCGFSVSCRHKTECRAWSYKHYRQAHLVKVENGYTCVEPGCDFSSRRGAHFRQHLLSHNRESSYECPSCSKQFRSSSHLAEHRKAVHEKARDVECEKCEKKFASRWSLTVHMRSHARDGEYRCAHCGGVFGCPQSLAGHVKSVHGGETPRDEKQFCECCGNYFKNKRELASHQDRTSPKTVSCPECQKKMPESSLKAHLQYHRGAARGHVCPYCQKVFGKLVGLQRHVLIHDDAKPYVCASCGKTFRQSSALATHERSHGQERFACSSDADGCGKVFVARALLSRHRKTCDKVIRNSSGQ